MPNLIEFGNTCSCASPCAGAVCWRPAQEELSRLLEAWRLRNPSPSYQVSSGSGRRFNWNPARRAIWDLLAVPGTWRQSYAVREEQVLAWRIEADGREESFVIEPRLRATPIQVAAPRLVALT